MKRVFAALLLSAPVVGFAAEGGKLVGDAEAGASKAAVCAACHGPAGKSTMPDWPKLAGQGAAYIEAQLHAFKSGERKNPVMSAQAVNLSDQDMADLGAYFAEQEAVPGVASEDSLAVAGPLYTHGDPARGIPACAGCHGPTGAGNPMAAYPHIGGQHAKYTATQLTAYRSGERGGSAHAKIMDAVAAQLTDEEIQALASYVNGLQ